MKKALITGMGGFCGRHLAALLQNEGLAIYGMGTFAHDARPYRLEHVADTAGMQAVLEELRPDYVFHLAGAVQAAEAAEIYRVNTEFAVALLEALARMKLDAPVLLVGTAAEYGLVPPEDLPVNEAQPCHPVSHYGISKLAQTHAGLAAARQGQRVVIVRPFNILGADMPEHLLAGTIARQVRDRAAAGDGQAIELGNLDATRDFVDVREVAAYYWALVQEPRAYGEVINICSGQETSVETLATRMLAIAGHTGGIHSTQARRRSGEISRHVGNPQKLFALTGRRPAFDLEASLRAVLGAGQGNA